MLTPSLFLTGHYGNISAPALSDRAKQKINSPHNSAVIEAAFYMASSALIRSHRFFHAVDFYGECVGTAARFVYDCEDERPWLERDPFFNRHVDRLFSFKEQLHAVEGGVVDSTLLDIDVLDGPIKEKSEKSEERECEESGCEDGECEESGDDGESGDGESATEEDGDDREKGEKEKGEEEDHSTHSDDSDDVSSFCSASVNETEDYASENIYLYHFPVQFIHIEQCECTLADLIQSPRWNIDMVAGMLFQVASTLCMYQSQFQFTHNDLHTRNIVCNRTDREFIFYTLGDKTYRVPTHGYIYKIIDFGRSIFTWKDRLYYSDEYAPHENAYGVYNSPPFFNPKRAEWLPNPAFDLCYLAVNLYNTLVPVCIGADQLNPLQKMLTNWVTDDYGNNIVRSRTGVPKNDGIKLYKVIARHISYPVPNRVLREEPVFHSFFWPKAVVEGALHIVLKK